MQIKKLRELEMLTQQQLAESLGIARSAVANWENGTANPRVDILPKLATVLHCTIDDLFGELDNKNPRADDQPGA